MMSPKEASRIANRKMKDYMLLECVDIGNRFAFSFGLKDKSVPPGMPIVCVDKANGEVTYMTIPPIENLKTLNNGKLVEV